MFRFGFRLWTILNRVSLVLGALVFALILGGQTAERYGDRLQVALPLVAYACAVTDRNGSELMARFAAVFFVSHASKRVLGETGINTRPSGGTHGFPSLAISLSVRRCRPWWACVPTCRRDGRSLAGADHLLPARCRIGRRRQVTDRPDHRSLQSWGELALLKTLAAVPIGNAKTVSAGLGP